MVGLSALWLPIAVSAVFVLIALWSFMERWACSGL
jgi:hypothetical protein